MLSALINHNWYNSALSNAWLPQPIIEPAKVMGVKVNKTIDSVSREIVRFFIFLVLLRLFRISFLVARISLIEAPAVRFNYYCDS